MQFSPKVNTAILSLYILVVISFTVLSVSVTSVVGLMNWGLMLGIMVWLLFQINLRPLFLFLGMTVIYFAIHLLVADTSPLAAGLFFANILLYLCLPYFRVQPEKIAGMLFALMIINALVGIKEILYSPFAGTVSEYFKGFFQNANTNGNFACCTLAAGLLFFKGKKQRFFLICLFVIYLFACKSRNALLFALITMFMYVLLSHRRFVRLAVWGYFLFFAACLLYLIVIEPMNLGEGVKVFGKEAESAGRSTQVLMAIARFPVTCFGVGADVPNDYVAAHTTYAIHNMYVNTFYAMGWGYMLIYAIFVFALYRNLRSVLAKALLMGFHIYFMFEPGMAFGTQLLSTLPIIIILIKYSQEKYENRTLHIQL